MTADGVEPDLPPATAPWVVEKLMEVGPVVSAGMGPGPITWRDIAAWQEVTGFPLDPWEARLLRTLSIDYLTMMNEARKLDCPAPWVPLRQGSVDRDAVERKIRGALQGLAALQKRG